jgi:hypothetical protein
METDLPVPIDDSLPYHEQPLEREQSQYYQEEPQYYRQYNPPPPPPPPTPQEQPQKKFDIFSELDRTHWIVIISCILLAFFMGKSIATPIIIRSVS